MNDSAVNSPFTRVIRLLISSAFLIELTISYRWSILGPHRPFKGDWAARVLLLLMSMELSHISWKVHFTLCLKFCNSVFPVDKKWSTIDFGHLRSSVINSENVYIMKKILLVIQCDSQKDWENYRGYHTHAQLSGGKGRGNPSWTKSGITGVQE